MKSATVCYIRDNDKTLMLHRTKKDNDVHEGKWLGVGGKFEEGESPKQCAIREIHEETGLVVADPVLKGICTFVSMADTETRHVFVYRVDDRYGELTDCSEGDLEWVDTVLLPDLNTRDAYKTFTQWLDEPGVFVASFDSSGTEYDVDRYGRA